MKAQRWMARVGVVLGIAVFGLVPISLGQDCPEFVEDLGADLWQDPPNQIVVSGPFAYLGSPMKCMPKPFWCDGSTIAIADVSVLEEPRFVNFLEVGTLIDFTVLGSRLYHHSLAVYRGGSHDYLGIVDVSDPSHSATLLNDRRIDGLRRIAVSGDKVFAATSDGLMVLDASDPSNPVEVGFLASPWSPSDLVVEGEFAYVTLPESGLSVIDVSDPRSPVEIGFLELTWEALDLEFQGGIAYVADGSSGLRVIDVTNPAAPGEVGILDIEAGASSVSVAGTVATVLTPDSFFHFVDVSNPASPEVIRRVDTHGWPLAADMSGTTVYMSLGTRHHSDPMWEDLFIDGRFSVVDSSDPISPVEIASYDYHSTAKDFEIADNVIYVAGGDAGLLVLDQSSPEGHLVEFLDTPGSALGVTLHGDLALVADDHRGVRVIDVSDPRNVFEVGFVDTPGQARRIVMAGDHAYVVDGEGGLRIIDVSIPESPVEIGAIETPMPVVDAVVNGTYAYVADGYLHIFDVSNPTDTVYVGPYHDIPSFALEIKDDVLYVAGASLSLFSLSYPDYPKLVASGRPFPVFNEPTNITLSGGLAYVLTRVNKPPDIGGGRAWNIPSTVQVFQIQAQYFPYWVDQWKDYGGDFWKAEVVNGRIYLAFDQPSISVYDIRCLMSYWVGIVTHQSGWRSDVFVSPEEDSSVDFEFVLHTEDGNFTAEASVDAGHQGVFEDIVGLLGYEGKAALEIQATDPITVSSKVYGESDPGTYGAFQQAYRSNDCFGSGRLSGLRQVEGEFRTNIFVTNTTDELRKVWITLYRTDGHELARYPLEIEPGLVVQDLQPFKHRAKQPDLGWGYATVEGEDGIIACASVIDSRTNDAVIVPLLP